MEMLDKTSEVLVLPPRQTCTLEVEVEQDTIIKGLGEEEEEEEDWYSSWLKVSLPWGRYMSLLSSALMERMDKTA